MATMYRLILLSAPVALLLGCGSTEQTRESIPPAFPPDTVATKPQPREMQIVAKTDTLVTLGVVDHGAADTARIDSTARFAVQIGAFKEPQNAATIQTLVREQYKEPVINEFNEKIGLYQIRVGRFATQQEAAAFLRRLLSEHPSSYKGSWVVQLGK